MSLGELRCSWVRSRLAIVAVALWMALLPGFRGGWAQEGAATAPGAGEATATDAVEPDLTVGERTPATVSEAPDIQAIIDAGRNSGNVDEYLDYLCNRIGPRLTSSTGLQAGCEWALETFQELGLQNCRLEKWGEFPVGFERGPSSGKLLEPKEMDLKFGTNAWTSGTRGRTVAAAVKGPSTLDELETMKDRLKGAWVFMPPSPPRRGGDPAALESYQKLRDGILACEPAGLVRSTRDELILTSGRYEITWENLPTIPEINLIKSQYDEIAALLEGGEPVKMAFDIRNFFRKGPIPLYNVIAEIPGTEFPDEYVVVGGHIDSWDGATGATDNAAGCATTIEAARILMAAGVKPRRTICFMLWSGEEQGLLGSKAFVQANPDFVAKVSAVFVHDGGTNYVAGIGVPADMREDIEKVFAPATRLDSRAPFEISEVDAINARGASDHSSFIGGGAPGFFWQQRGRATYRTTHHTQYDTSESIVPEYQEHSAIVIALGAYGTANLDHMLSRASVRQRGEEGEFGAGGRRGRRGEGREDRGGEGRGEGAGNENRRSDGAPGSTPPGGAGAQAPSEAPKASAGNGGRGTF